MPQSRGARGLRSPSASMRIGAGRVRFRSLYGAKLHRHTGPLGPGCPADARAFPSALHEITQIWVTPLLLQGGNPICKIIRASNLIYA